MITHELESVISQRAELVRQLKLQIDHAYENRAQETYIEDLQTSAESIKQAESDAHFLASHSDDHFVNITFPPDQPERVFVTDAHLYPILLRMAIEKLIETGNFFKGAASFSIRGILNHEYGHHIHVVGDRNLQVMYGVRFVEDKLNGINTIEPRLLFSGGVSIGQLKKTANTVNPSAGDLIVSQS